MVSSVVVVDAAVVVPVVVVVEEVLLVVVPPGMGGFVISPSGAVVSGCVGSVGIGGVTSSSALTGNIGFIGAAAVPTEAAIIISAVIALRTARRGVFLDSFIL